MNDKGTHSLDKSLENWLVLMDYHHSSLVILSPMDRWKTLAASSKVFCVGSIRTDQSRVTAIIHSHETAPRTLDQSGTISSAILANLVNFGHCIDPNQEFRVIYQLLPNQSKHIWLKTIRNCWSIRDQTFDPQTLCTKCLVHAPHRHTHASMQHSNTNCRDTDRMTYVT